jgi:peptidoglycan lytic transglycosylase D
MKHLLHFVRRPAAILLCGLSLLLLAACATVPKNPDTNTDRSANVKAGHTVTKPVDTQNKIIDEKIITANDGKLVKETLKNNQKYTDVWQRIRGDYALPTLYSARIQDHEEWFARNPKYVLRMSQRARLYLYYIAVEVEKRGMPMEIAMLPAIESAFRPHARSRARAVGIWQFIRSTGKRFGMKINWWRDGRRDIVLATKGALDYLEKLHIQFGNWHLALAAYNAGESRVQRAITYNRRRGLPANYQNLGLKPETLNYVPKLIALTNIIRDPDKYDIKLAAIPNTPYFDFVEVGSQIDLGIIARKSGIPMKTLYDLNPGHKRWATDPAGPHHLLIPVAKVDTVLDVLGSLPKNKRVVWRRHTIRQGQTLGYISRLYGVSIVAIKRANRIRGHIIRVGGSLMIPASSGRIRRLASRKKKSRPRHATPRKPVAPPKNRVSVIHVVRAGDTLWSISRKYNVYVRELVNWNTLRRRSLLRLGQKIKVWIVPNRLPLSASNSNSG